MSGKVKRFKLKVLSDPQNLSLIREWVSTSGKEADLSPEEISQLKLAINEACSNIIRHAYEGDKNKVIILQLNFDHEKLVFEARDFGKKFDPTKYKEPDLGRPLEGGYGRFIIRSLVDEVDYDTSPEKGTKLRLVKYR